MVPGLSEEVALFQLQVQSFTPENLLFVSTLDGSLHALSKQTGDLKWTLKDGKEGLSLLGPQAGGGHLRIRAWGLESNTQVSSVSFTTYPGCVALKSHFSSLSLNVLTCEIGPRVTTLPTGEVLHYAHDKMLTWCPAHGKYQCEVCLSMESLEGTAHGRVLVPADPIIQGPTYVTE